RPGLDHRSVQHDRPGADERTVVDGAALEVREVADHAVTADDRRVQLGAVHHGAVLDRRALPDGDVPVVTTQHGMGPDGRVCTNGDVPDHGRIRVDVGTGMNSG